MAKVIRLIESDIENLVKKIIKEESLSEAFETWKTPWKPAEEPNPEPEPKPEERELTDNDFWIGGPSRGWRGGGNVVQGLHHHMIVKDKRPSSRPGYNNDEYEIYNIDKEKGITLILLGGRFEKHTTGTRKNYPRDFKDSKYFGDRFRYLADDIDDLNKKYDE